MKLSEVKSILLNEMPYERPGEMRRTGVSGAFISDNALKRKYSYLGFIEVFGNISVELHFHKSSQVVFGTIKEKDKDDFDSNQVIFSLMFKETNTLKEIPKKIDIKKILQVDKVTINEKFENFGVASFAYATLVNRGYTILSDIDQFSDGKELWKRMARRAHLRDYRIYILHDEHGFLEKDGKPIEYNASNIDDAEIWQHRWGAERVKLLTQNVDTLLEQAGATAVTHLHGDLKHLLCTACSHRWPVSDEEYNERARCVKCGSLKGVKPGVVLFNEAAPEYSKLNRVYKTIHQGDIFLVVGSSMEVVTPNLMVPLWRKGHELNWQVNPEPAFKHYFGQNLAKTACDGLEELEPELVKLM